MEAIGNVIAIGMLCELHTKIHTHDNPSIGPLRGFNVNDRVCSWTELYSWSQQPCTAATHDWEKKEEKEELEELDKYVKEKSKDTYNRLEAVPSTVKLNGQQIESLCV